MYNYLRFRTGNHFVLFSELSDVPPFDGVTRPASEEPMVVLIIGEDTIESILMREKRSNETPEF